MTWFLPFLFSPNRNHIFGIDKTKTNIFSPRLMSLRVRWGTVYDLRSRLCVVDNPERVFTGWYGYLGSYWDFSTWCHHKAHGCNSRICKGGDQAKQSFSHPNSTKNVNAKLELLKTSKQQGTGFCKINLSLEFINVSAVIWSNKWQIKFSGEREEENDESQVESNLITMLL